MNTSSTSNPQISAGKYGYSFVEASLSSHDLTEMLLRHLEEEHSFSRERLSRLLAERKEAALIPVSIFTRRLSGLETIIKYMTENLGLKNREIAAILNRDIRTVWRTYKNSLRKYPSRFALAESEPYFIPASELGKRQLSILETIVAYLSSNYNLKIREIALLIKRNISTIWTVQRRARQKQANIMDAQVDY